MRGEGKASVVSRLAVRALCKSHLKGYSDCTQPHPETTPLTLLTSERRIRGQTEREEKQKKKRCIAF